MSKGISKDKAQIKMYTIGEEEHLRLDLADKYRIALEEIKLLLIEPCTGNITIKLDKVLKIANKVLLGVKYE